MYKKILVPLDMSELAEVALPYAEELAARLESEVTLICVRAPAENPSDPIHPAYLQEMVRATKHFAESNFSREIKVGSAIIVGLAAEEIVDYADKEDISLIVMATHGRSGIRRWILGSVADKVVRATRRPVMLIRAKGARPDIREKGVLGKVLVPLDGSREGEAVVPYVEELATKLRAEVVLLHVVVEPYKVFAGSEGVVQVRYTEDEMKSQKAIAKDYLGKAGNRLKGKGFAIKFKVRVGSPAEEIIKLADEIHASMVAMSTHGRSGFSRWEYGSVADKVIRAGSTPLILVRPNLQAKEG